MPEIFKAGSVEEAVERAQAFKAEGRYNWFRGQVQDWPPFSSLFRIRRSGDTAAIEKVQSRYLLFCDWLTENPALRYLLEEESLHQFSAVAQHYGIPTNYIDFTTDPAVAGFFSADSPTPPANGMSCMYCVDTKDLLEVADDMKAVGVRDRAILETVEVDVTNLWRLQAQRGVFLLCDYNWDVDYPMDRIIFPYTGYPSYPERDYIYPKEKSALELLLEQYFDIEKKHFGREYIRDMVADLQAKGANASIQTMESFPNGFYAEGFLEPDKLAPLASWGKAQEPAWRTYPDEHFDDVGGHMERIHLRAGDRQSLQRAVGFAVKQLLDAKPQHRAKLIEWVPVDETNKLPVQELSTLFRSAWNGMRSLPFSNAQIATAFATITGLLSAGFRGGLQREDVNRCFSDVRGDGINLEMAYADYASSRGFAPTEALRGAIRSDLKALVLPQYQAQMDDLRFVFQLVQNPRLLFEFEPLVDIFACDLIPTQILLRRTPTLFNPAELTIVGLP
ncbi:MAG TPA: FRG domain-containing protein [Rhizomicrobium sp.]|jgi:hypothetical protein